MVHFDPAKVGHFRPASYGHFNPARVVYYVRRFHIIYSLCQSKKRFNELQADLKGVSPRALSNALKDLEVNGLVNREVFPTVPTTVEYSLTDYGDELETVLVAIQDWGKKHRERIIGKF